MMMMSAILRRLWLPPLYSTVRPTAPHANPFRNKPYIEIDRILDNMTASEQSLDIYGLILQAVVTRIQDQMKSKNPGQAVSNNAKSKLINKCIASIISRPKQFTPETVLVLGQALLFMQEKREFYLQEDSAKTIMQLVPAYLEQMMRNDNEGEHVDIIYQILLIFNRVKRKGMATKKVIEYLYNHGLDTNEKIIKFFIDMNKHPKNAVYHSSMEALVVRYIKLNSADPNPEWNPLVFETIVRYDLIYKESIMGLILLYIEGIRKSLAVNLPLGRKISFFRYFIQFIKIHPKQLLTNQDLDNTVRLVYELFLAIKQELPSQIDDYLHMQNLLAIHQSYVDFVRSHCLVLKKSSRELEQDMMDVLERGAESMLGSSSTLLNRDAIVCIAIKKIEFREEIQTKIVELIIRFLEEPIPIEFLVFRIRLFEYVTHRILEGRLKFPTHSFIAILKQLERQASKNNNFMLVRLYTILRVLNIESKEMKELYDHLCKTNLPDVIENISRTMLKLHSQDELQRLGMMVVDGVKSREPFENDKCVWFTFKSYQNEREANMNQFYKFWLQDHPETFSSIFRQFKIQIIKFINKEISSPKGEFTSTRAEVVIQIFHVFNKDCKKGDFGELESSERLFSQSAKVTSIILNKFRHSFPIKLMWLFCVIFQSHVKDDTLFRIYLLSKQLIYLIRIDEDIRTHREARDFRKIFLLSVINQIEIVGLLKIGNYRIIETWMWVIANNLLPLSHTSRGIEESGIEEIRKAIKLTYGPHCELEFLLNCERFSQIPERLIKLSIFPAQIIDGTFKLNSKISASTLLSLLSYPKTLEYFCKLHPTIAETYFRKLVEGEETGNNSQIINASNAFNSLRWLLSPSTRQEFHKWVIRSLELMHRYSDCKLPTLCLKLNIIPEFAKHVVDSYVREQLNEGDFYLASVLYSNGYTGIADEVKQMLETTRINRVLVFFVEESLYAKKLLLNNLFGLVLLQNNVPLLEYFVANFIQDISELDQGRLTGVINGYQTDFYMLLKLAELRLKSSDSLKLVSAALSKYELQAGAAFRVHESISRQILRIVQSQKIKADIVQTEHKGLKLPKSNQNYLILEQFESGPCGLILEYVRSLSGLETAKSVRASEYQNDQAVN